MADDMAEQLISALSYDPETGILTWKNCPDRSPQWNGIYAGKRAGGLNREGYAIVRFKRKFFLAHRIAWLLHFGRWPSAVIDHINGNPADNRLANLREASVSENAQNRTVNSNNTSGFTGVRKVRGCNRWAAVIRHKYKDHYLGTAETPEAAYALYLEGKKRLHTFHSEPRAALSEKPAAEKEVG